MKIIITEEQRKSLNEMIKLDIKVGDTLMGGKFKNKKVVVKTIGKNDKGDITINGKPLLRFRMLKENVNSKMDNLFDDYMNKLHPDFLVDNIKIKMSSGEDTLYFYTDNVRFGATFFIDISYYDEVDGKHLYFNKDKYIEEFSNVFGKDKWAELFLKWVNKEYEPKLKREFNEIDWKITGVD